MKQVLKTDQRGSVVAIIVAVIAVVAVAGIGYFAWSNTKKNAENATGSIASKLAEAKCEYDDKDLCKFFTSYKEHKNYKVTGKTVSGEEESTSVIKAEGKDKTHMTVSGGGLNMETITIGKTTYTKGADGTWWKQTSDDTKLEEGKSESEEIELVEPTEAETSMIEYKKIGKEKCGDLECLKYEVIDPKSSDTTQYIWFDTKDYQIRRMTIESPDGSSDMTYSYEDVKVTEPSPVKELGPNQYLVPGQSEPTTMPDMSQYQM